MMYDMLPEIIIMVIAFLIGLLGRYSRVKSLEDEVVNLIWRNKEAYELICKREKEVEYWNHKSIQLEDELLEVRRENSRLKDDLLKIN